MLTSKELVYHRMKRLIWAPVGVFALTLLAVYSFDMFLTIKKQVAQVEPTLISMLRQQHGLFSNELFLQQWDALSVRLKQIESRIESEYPKRSICLELKSSTGNKIGSCDGISSIADFDIHLGQQVIGKISYYFNKSVGWKYFLPSSFLISLMISILITFFLIQILTLLMKNKIVSPLLIDIENKSREAGIGKITSQVAHDIRSPLAAFEMLLAELTELPEDKRVILRNAINRVRDIANDLIKKGKPINNAQLQDRASIELLPSLIENIISEKRVQLSKKSKIEIIFKMNIEAYSAFVNVSPAEFKRVLSNLMNNSIEAIVLIGRLEISIQSSEKELEILLIDNGKGIQKEVITKLISYRESFGKKEGSGLGLYHAKKSIESFGGKIEIASEVGKGTMVKIKLPRVLSPPSWFVSEIKLEEELTVVILDDDPSVHKVWEHRFKNSTPSNYKISIIHCISIAEFKSWYSSRKISNSIYLIDYEFAGEAQTGIDLINNLNLHNQSILVTSRYEEKNIRDKCQQFGIKLIPKDMCAYIPINSKLSKIKFDAVLIDDDKLIHMIWNFSAKNHSKKLLAFTTPDDFFEKMTDIDFSTPVFIDSNLLNNVKGEVVSKSINEAGFKEIYLSTGFLPDEVKPGPWITGVIGKAPPW